MALSRHFRALATTLCVFMVASSFSQGYKYWIRLKDKQGTPYSTGAPESFLTQKSIDRRSKYNISVNESDLPVAPAYVARIAAVNHVRVLYASKWLNGVVISIGDSASIQPALSEIATFSFVASSAKVNRYKLDLKLPVADPVINGRLTGMQDNYYGKSGGQIRQLKINCLHERGFRGQCMTIAVCDIGFINVNTLPVFDSLRARGGILGTRDFVNGGTDAYQGGTHGTLVLSCLAAVAPGTIIGTAPYADYWLLKTEEGAHETISEEYNWVRAAEFADSVGVDIITTSLGYTEFDDPQQNHTYASLNGRTAPMSIASNMAARKGILVFNAAGNEGNGTWKYISVAGDADSICTVGAVDTLGRRASFSSVGPTADGRIKPDLAACGAGACVCDESGNIYIGANGTSFATPILAGAAACYWQAHRSYNNIKLLQLLKASGSNTLSPNNLVGWGIPAIPCDTINGTNESCARDVVPNNAGFAVFGIRPEGKVTIFLPEGTYNDVFFSLYDLLGRSICEGYLPKAHGTITFNAGDLSQEIYVVKLSATGFHGIKKMLVR